MEKLIRIDDAHYPYSETCIRGEKYYRISLKVGKYPNGRSQYKTISAKTKEEVIKKTKQILSSTVTCSKKIAITQLANDWLKSKLSIVAPATYDKVESVIRVHIIPDIGENTIECLKEKFLQNYINELALKGNKNGKTKNKGLSYNSLKKIHSVLSELCDYAVRMDYVDKNYVKYVTIPKYVKKPKEKKILDDNGLCRFLYEVDRKKDNGEYVYYYRNAIVFMLLTGLRPCEIFALEKDMVDFDNKFIRIERNRVRTKKRNSSGEFIGGYVNKIYDDTKNEASRRIVPLTDEAFQILVDSCNKTKGKLCFPNKEGNIVKQTTFTNKFNYICKKAMVDITPYSLRHTFASNVFYNSNLDIAKLARLLGHSTPKVTYDTYIHQIEQKEMLISKQLENIYTIIN